jgi:hypothetical protein
MAQSSRIPLLTVAGTTDIHPAVSAAILLQVAVRLDRWVSARNPQRLIVPRLEDILLERGGRVWWCRGRGMPTTAGVAALGHLLEALLSRAPERHATAGLLYVVSRATDSRHLAPIRSLREFAGAVARHAPSRPLPTIDALIASHLARASGAATVDGGSTIADVRRWRRAGGTSLKTIAADTHIPISLLRELEWGVFDNWMLPHTAQSLSAYAQRAGLEPSVVLAVVAREQQHCGTLVPVGRQPVALVAPRAGLVRDERVLPFAIAALLVGMLAATAPGDPRTDATPVAAESIVERPVPPVDRPVPASDTGKVEEPEPVAAPADDREPVRPPTTQRMGRSSRASSTRQRARIVHPAVLPPAAPSLPVREPAAHPDNPLRRFARALAGDGRHRVEPFPRPAAEEPPP